MRNIAMLVRLGALCATLALLVAARDEVRAQPAAAEPPPAPATVPTDLSQAELLKSYLEVREQLHAAQLAIANNRLAAEATARAQADAIAAKLDAIKAAMEAERERHQDETQRQEAERERQDAATQHSERTVIWVASTFGGLGVIALLFTALFQWRAISRLEKAPELSLQLPAPAPQALLRTEREEPSDQAVAQSNQRLLSAIDRMERRIFELEHTTATPLPAGPADGLREAASPRRAAEGEVTENSARISMLLGQGRALLRANKAMEALDCFDEILKLDPNHAEGLVKKGATLERLKQDNEAIRCYDRAIQADRKMTLAYLSKGGVFYRLERFSEAVECYEEALRVAEEAR